MTCIYGCKWIMDDQESEFGSIEKEKERLTCSALSLTLSNICPVLQHVGLYKTSTELKESVCVGGEIAWGLCDEFYV